ncbi:MAG: hypothetical protein CSYNP_04417 [Syntrophus sp. SKADARSKE-3]|nr:hypothetical protein [Syntrophus sp. SKADARSKE-3]
MRILNLMRNKAVLAIMAIVLLIAAVRALPVRDVLLQALAGVNGLGPWGPFLFALVYVTACVVFVPASLLTLGAGVLFGVVKGTIIVSISSIVGATAAFAIGRYLARDWVSTRISRIPKFKAIDDRVAEEGWKIVGLTRLSPLFPFNMLNYAYGVTKISFKDYVFASWAGMLPGTVLYVYSGSLAGDLTGLTASGGSRNPAEWVLYIGGFAATVVVTVYVTHIARTALHRAEQRQPETEKLSVGERRFPDSGSA